ncbi:hypothetical protein, partial [Bacillus subtilis]|uniref:hypothetical protein n=1 Tax=Bacillus subtilis TaxID=1423 RepID=UPI001BDBABAA
KFLPANNTPNQTSTCFNYPHLSSKPQPLLPLKTSKLPTHFFKTPLSLTLHSTNFHNNQTQLLILNITFYHIPLKTSLNP